MQRPLIILFFSNSLSEMSWVHTSDTSIIVDKTEPMKVEKSPVAEEKPPSPVQERKERSVIREIIAFVRKPSKKATTTTAATTRTGRFANAFTRAESSSASPLPRQSTFSSSPAASSRAAKSAVTKQMSLQHKVLDFNPGNFTYQTK